MQVGAERDAGGFSVLSRADCMRLLERGGVGRIAVPGESVPTMRPVNFALQDGRIVMRTPHGALWAAAVAGVGASFEIDEISNEDHRTWNVIVTGTLEALDADGEAGRGPVNAWAPSPKGRSIALRIAEVSGRQAPDPHAPAALSPATPSAGAADGGHRVPVRDAEGIDRWGRSERTRTVVRELIEPAYRYWFRFHFEHLERIPMGGGAVLVANHAGVVPVDGVLVMHGIERELHRAVYGLHHSALAGVPGWGVVLARAGGVVAHPDNALRLVRDDGQLLLVFPEGTKGTAKLYRDRYRMARFGRGGFVDTAIRAGVPVVPIAIVGSEETMPTVARLPGNWPVTLNAVLFGPVAAGVHFPAAITARVLEPVVFDEPPGLEHYPTYRVADGAEMIRARIQAAIDEMVPSRTWRGRR